ncbi:MAG: hypothetical protein ACLR7Z_15775 [Bilophila wadsworthia]
MKYRFDCGGGRERRPSDAIVDCMAKHAARSLGNDVGEAVNGIFPEQRRPVGESARHRLPA